MRRGCMLARDRAAIAEGDARDLLQRFEFPTPRVALGQALRGLASACIDVSDGVYVDATRLLQASGCGAKLEIERLPLSPALQRCSAIRPGAARCPAARTTSCALPPRPGRSASATCPRHRTAITRIGSVRANPGIVLQSEGVVMEFSPSGFDHFRDSR